MSDPIITMCPTMANPEAFSSVPELRQELHRANESIFGLADRLHRMNGLANYLSDRLIKLVQAHLAEDQTTIQAELTELAENYQREQQAKQGRQH
ncbi:MAG: hypothetical protein COW48_10505 [Hydrogenophilales bacterium CG17_big_fil_post_rev_8_21_14_2_50_63_12]|nr:MAG: hypothetical protein COW48_10505 [Hydrogenophilales bacterium CG17_big_fil_post_rev_8_21_14_2_50_63_12]PIX97019.1 MAG: hypothetical protein COZ24_07250 [Hydrogenophilales bacterium CG_4_10_14_3_um_filter_63_21]PJB02323.1 MAG: hypothetical protein CO126_12230 [Hydrogenophilales bacterium CG_4_9_14_3_um_filter_63_34]